MAQRVTEHEYIATAQPGQRYPGLVTAQAFVIVEVVAKIQLVSIESQLAQCGKLTLDARAADVLRRVVQRIRDGHRAVAAVAAVANERREVLRMIAHPEGRQVEPHQLTSVRYP